MKTLWHRSFSFALVFLLLWAPLVSVVGAVPPVPPTGGRGEPPGSSDRPLALIDPEILPRIEPALLKWRVEGDGTARFIVHLKEEADLAAATAGEVGSLERGRAVIASLRVTADRSQGELREYLSGQEVAGKISRYTPFWIFNGLAVEGDLETVLTLAARPDVRVIRADHKRYLEPQEASNGTMVSSAMEWNIAKVRAELVGQ